MWLNLFLMLNLLVTPVIGVMYERLCKYDKGFSLKKQAIGMFNRRFQQLSFRVEKTLPLNVLELEGNDLDAFEQLYVSAKFNDLISEGIFNKYHDFWHKLLICNIEKTFKTIPTRIKNVLRDSLKMCHDYKKLEDFEYKLRINNVIRQNFINIKTLLTKILKTFY